MEKQSFIRRKVSRKDLSGFTIVELLVVVAIIGLLSSVVFVNVKGTRFKANDAVVKSHMHQIRNEAEMRFSETESYDEVCNDDDNTLSDAGLFMTLERAIKENNGNQDVSCYESGSKKYFAVSSPLLSLPGKSWCIESVGLSVELDCPDIASFFCECP